MYKHIWVKSIFVTNRKEKETKCDWLTFHLSPPTMDSSISIFFSYAVYCARADSTEVEINGKFV